MRPSLPVTSWLWLSQPAIGTLIRSGFRILHDDIQGEPPAWRGKQATKGLRYPAYNLTTPVDHFHNDSLYEPHSSDFFNMSYWYDASHYKPGGPVIVLCGGETAGSDRLPFLEKGILHQLAEATNGIGVVLEHRYYGTSLPTPDLSTANLRFLTTDQALADTAYFARHVRLPGLDDNADAAWLAYGGSYAGAFAAFLRKLYPDVYWGAISSSAVTEAIVDYWEYWEAQREHGPPACIRNTERLTDAFDKILLPLLPGGAGAGANQNQRPSHSHGQKLKDVFGLGNITHDDDFVALLTYGVAGWQSRNWDPAISDSRFDEYCRNLTTGQLLYPDLGDRRAAAEELLATGGYGDQAKELAAPLLNYAGWIRANYPCKPPRTQEYCFSVRNVTAAQQHDLAQWPWRSWTYQYCTQWGYFPTGSGTPSDRLPLVSRLLTLPYLSLICRNAFDITTLPDVGSINKHGGLGLSYPRVAFVDGEADPWRAATPHAHDAPARNSSTAEPFLLIGGGAIHHWDENGVRPPATPPGEVAAAQAAELRWVKAWLAEWTVSRDSVVSVDGPPRRQHPL